MEIRIADASEHPLQFHWQAVEGPAPLPPVGNRAQYTFTPTQEGTYVFEVAFSDGQSPPKSARVSIPVKAAESATPEPAPTVPAAKLNDFSTHHPADPRRAGAAAS